MPTTTNTQNALFPSASPVLSGTSVAVHEDIWMKWDACGTVGCFCLLRLLPPSLLGQKTQPDTQRSGAWALFASCPLWCHPPLLCHQSNQMASTQGSASEEDERTSSLKKTAVILLLVILAAVFILEVRDPFCCQPRVPFLRREPVDSFLFAAHADKTLAQSHSRCIVACCTACSVVVACQANWESRPSPGSKSESKHPCCRRPIKGTGIGRLGLAPHCAAESQCVLDQSACLNGYGSCRARRAH